MGSLIHQPRFLYMAMVGLLLLSACTTASAPEAAATPVPNFALPEHLPLESTAAQPDAWPTLPDDLFFLRAGQVWRLPAGGSPETLVQVTDSEIVDYRVTSDGVTVAYRTADGALGTVNRKTGDQVRITLPNRRAYVGFSLAPDGTAVSVSDAEGLWLVTLPDGTLTQLLGNPASEAGLTTTWLPGAWSSDGRWLLANLASSDNYPLYLIDVQSARFRKVQDGCQGEVPQAAWSGANLWVSTSECGAAGDLALLEIAADSDWPVLRRSPEAYAGKLVPFGWMALPGDRLAFANYDAGAGVPSGLYFLEADGTLATLLSASCVAAADGSCIPVEWGLVTWAHDARAFVLTGVEGTVVIGDLEAGALWDMRALLGDATLFQWALP
ncbi:MAG: hypothetical protein JW892_00890 [Anaerolineae bacterium]|nr:hypothetical protein [Anaerolineae bacterium]